MNTDHIILIDSKFQKSNRKDRFFSFFLPDSLSLIKGVTEDSEGSFEKISFNMETFPEEEILPLVVVIWVFHFCLYFLYFLIIMHSF